MWVGAGITFCLLHLTALSGSFKLDKNFNNFDVEWQCGAFCAGSGGNAVFNQISRICVCTFNNKLADHDADRIMKNARNAGLGMVIIQPSSDLKVRSKRQAITTRRPLTLFTQHTSMRPALITLRKISPRPITLPTISMPARARGATALTGLTTPNPVQKRLIELQSRINQMRESRGRPTISLQPRAGFPLPSTPSMVNQIRERQKQRHSESLLGSAVSSKANSATTMENAMVTRMGPPLLTRSMTTKKSTQASRPNTIQGQIVGSNLKQSGTKSGMAQRASNQKAHQEIITQDPSLIDDDDDEDDVAK